MRSANPSGRPFSEKRNQGEPNDLRLSQDHGRHVVVQLFQFGDRCRLNPHAVVRRVCRVRGGPPEHDRDRSGQVVAHGRKTEAVERRIDPRGTARPVGNKLTRLSEPERTGPRKANGGEL